MDKHHHPLPNLPDIRLDIYLNLVDFWVVLLHLLMAGRVLSASYFSRFQACLDELLDAFCTLTPWKMS